MGIDVAVVCLAWLVAALVPFGLGFLIQAFLISKPWSVPAWFHRLLDILWVAFVLVVTCRMAVQGSVDQITSQIFGIVFLIVLVETLFRTGRAFARSLFKEPTTSAGEPSSLDIIETE